MIMILIRFVRVHVMTVQWTIFMCRIRYEVFKKTIANERARTVPAAIG